MKRLLAGFVAAAFAATTLCVGAIVSPAAADGDGIGTTQFAYVYENDSWLANICALTTNKPAYVVLNIGNGTTDDVGHLDEISQECIDNGIPTLGYVNTWTGSAYRSLYDVATDVSRWVNPYNPERNNYDQMVSGIFFDQVQRDCGPIETPTNNTANDSDYALEFSNMADAVEDGFSFWSYGDPLVVANVGTAVRGCLPGLAGIPLPTADRWVTSENDADTYEGGWAGGNILTGGATGTTYEDGNYYFPGVFDHIAHGSADMAQTERVIDLADVRGAANIFVTDDVMANPYDTEPTRMEGAAAYAALSPMPLRLDYGNDFVTTQTGPDVAVLREARDAACDNPYTTPAVERCAFPTDGISLTFDALDAACGSAGDWGTVDAGLGDPPDSAVIACVRALMEDGTGRDSVGVVCMNTTHIREWTDEDPNQDEADCQDIDGDGIYVVDSTQTGRLRTLFFSTDTRASATIVYLRDWANLTVNESGYTRAAACLGSNANESAPAPHWLCPS